MEKRIMQSAGFGWIVVFLLLITACGGGESDGSNPDRTAISGEIEGSAFFGSGLFEESGNPTANASPSGSMEKGNFVAEAGGVSCEPVAWARGNVSRLNREIGISISGNTASVTVTDLVAGTLFIGTADDTLGNPLEKTFRHVRTRRGTFTRESSGWRLTQISPVDASLEDAAQQTVQIQKVSASVNGSVVWETTSSSLLFDVPSGIPTFAPETEVLVEVEVSNSNASGCDPASYVFLHRPGAFGRVRDLMYDDGATEGDKVAGDGIFSRAYTIGNAVGRHFAVVDLIDAATFKDQTTPYNATAWGMPYLVE
jgi:hypothetical protein